MHDLLKSRKFLVVVKPMEYLVVFVENLESVEQLLEDEKCALFSELLLLGE